MISQINIFRLSFCILLFTVVKGHGQSSPDSVIFNAMRDELNRNMNYLSDERYEKPFFIAYSLADIKNTIVNATLGAISVSDQREYKDWQVRVMVGDYEINDENFNYDQPQENIIRQSIEMPLDNDYSGIRRSLWLTTNNVYNSAAQSFKTKMDMIEHKQLDESDLQIPDFSRAPVVDIKIQNIPVVPDRTEIEQYTKELSALFKPHSEIYYSDVTCNIFQSTVYFINSEGSEVIFPFNLTTLSIQAGTMTEDSERIHRKFAYAFNSHKELPDIESVTQDVQSFIDNLLLLREAERFTDSYTGPVLILNEAVAKTFENVLFSGMDKLIANRESLHSSSQMNLYYDRSSNDLESRIDKLILAKDLTITAEPKLSDFNGISLLGNFRVDAEGVVPPEKLVLVEEGKLITLLNGRTPSRNVTESNGHMRYNYAYGGLEKKTGPGIIKVTSSNPESHNLLKERLIQKAVEEGLEYAIIIKPLNVGGSMKHINIYKISLETGEETIVRSVRIKPPTLNKLKRHQGISGNLIVHNALLSGSSGRNSTPFPTGMPVSFIAPDALLLEDIELESMRKPLTSILPVIENPVGFSNSDSLTE